MLQFITMNALYLRVRIAATDGATIPAWNCLMSRREIHFVGYRDGISREIHYSH